MAHRNYHEVVAADHVACGRALGLLFGSTVRDYVNDERRSKAWPRRMAAAEPYLSHTARHFPAYVEELMAYADAARLPLLELWTMGIGDELDTDRVEKCTTVVANNGHLIAHNEDWDSEAVDDICILKKTCAGVITLELYYYACPLGGTALSLCSRGYVQAINSLNHTDHQVGVPKLMMARRLSELSNADTELSPLLAIPRASGFAHTLVDRSGRVTAIECSARRHSVHRPAMPFVHTNHMLQSNMADVEDAFEGESTYERYDAACALARSTMDEPALIKLSGDQTRGSTDSVFNENTIARAIVDLDRRVARFWLRREHRKGWIDYPIDFMFEPGARAKT